MIWLREERNKFSMKDSSMSVVSYTPGPGGPRLSPPTLSTQKCVRDVSFLKITRESTHLFDS